MERIFLTTLNNPHDSAYYHVKFSERVGFGLGDLAINITWASLGMYIVYFYTDVVGIGAAIIGTLMLLGRIFDGIIDVAMGTLVDKTQTRSGKARPWLIWASIPFALLTVLLFTVPDVAYNGKVIYIFISYMLLMVAFPAIAIPYGTLNSLITQDQHERETLNIFRMFLAQIGVLLVTNATQPLVGLFGGKQSGWIWTYVLLCSITVILFFVVFAKTKERVRPAANSDKAEKVALSVSFKALSKNKYWWLATSFFVIYSVGYALNQSGTIYYAKYIIGNENLVGMLTLAYLIPVMIGFLFLSAMFKKYGKRNSMIAGLVVSILGLLFTLINPSSTFIVTLSQIIKGIGQIPLLGGVWALFPDTIEYGEWKTHIRNEGLLYSGGSFGQKFGVGIGTALTGWILAWGGYIGEKSVQSSSALFSINAIFIYLPIALFVVQIILMAFYNLDKIYPTVTKELQARKAAV
jgi:GPH family glycoside/pentoside/hexuronide:cation symporter